jgi:hypothetical protein
MTNVDVFKKELPPDHAQRTRKLILTAGAGYGVIFGLSFAIFTWGYDAYVLASNGAAFPWVKLFLGLPLSVAIGGLVGWLGVYSSSVILSVAVWAAFGALMGVIASHIPFDGSNLFYWIMDRRLWGEIILSYGESAAVRTTLVVFINAIIGIAVGLFENVAVQWAWERATSSGKMSFGSWVVLLVGVPLALIMAATVNGFINQPLRFPQQAVGKLVKQTLAGEIDGGEAGQSNYRSIAPYLELFTDQFESHFVKFQSATGTWDSAYVDIVFDNGFIMRCATITHRVIYCDNLSQRFTDWVGELVRAGLYGERPWLEADIKRLVVHESVVDWLGAHRDQLSETYEWKRHGQYADWIYISVEFDTGFGMLCRFREASPVLLDQCVEFSPATSSR